MKERLWDIMRSGKNKLIGKNKGRKIVDESIKLSITIIK